MRPTSTVKTGAFSLEGMVMVLCSIARAVMRVETRLLWNARDVIAKQLSDSCYDFEVAVVAFSFRSQWYRAVWRWVMFMTVD
jgi:hypothetical protein